ncbi:hypothetical protein ACIA03_16955 [Nocardioides sp. NPDC051685]|uniref:hypothetical protein n=1 Tax=Nocardioides sp. NPDC051685 TaxID=3364334 RepID=UPI003791F656
MRLMRDSPVIHTLARFCDRGDQVRAADAHDPLSGGGHATLVVGGEADLGPGAPAESGPAQMI